MRIWSIGYKSLHLHPTIPSNRLAFSPPLKASRYFIPIPYLRINQNFGLNPESDAFLLQFIPDTDDRYSGAAREYG